MHLALLRIGNMKKNKRLSLAYFIKCYTSKLVLPGAILIGPTLRPKYFVFYVNPDKFLSIGRFKGVLK